MMIDKRLIGTVPESRKYIAANVALQWCGLVANVAMMMSVASLLASQLSAQQRPPQQQPARQQPVQQQPTRQQPAQQRPARQRKPQSADMRTLALPPPSCAITDRMRP